MNDPIELAIKINNKIAELPEAKEYLRLKAIISKSEEIQDLQKEIVSLQNLGKKDEAKVLMSRLDSMPIIVNFKYVQEQLAGTLRIISDILK